MTTEATEAIGRSAATATVPPDELRARTLDDIAGMLRELLAEEGLDDVGIERGTRFHDDLELESIDLVTLAGSLREHYGEKVNVALFIADLELDEIIALTVGQLVDFVTDSLRAAP
ncbi:acyl carrier protein [Streptomyces sp. NPDC058195]|uniref:acyl carrier protein n=1 Tax=Streptomyces sp. NPDC058195 TaxID=3346375 RepID=UPI0036E6778E